MTQWAPFTQAGYLFWMCAASTCKLKRRNIRKKRGKQQVDGVLTAGAGVEVFVAVAEFEFYSLRGVRVLAKAVVYDPLK